MYRSVFGGHKLRCAADADRHSSLFTVWCVPNDDQVVNWAEGTCLETHRYSDCVVAEFCYRVSCQETTEENSTVPVLENGTPTTSGVRSGALGLRVSGGHGVEPMAASSNNSLAWSAATVMHAPFLAASKLSK